MTPSVRSASNRRPAAAERCKNLYRFIRLVLGDAPSDRELARRWVMDWKSFSALKHGKRQMPRVDELESLAHVLDVDPTFVFNVARGIPAEDIIVLLRREHRLRALLDRATDAVLTIDQSGRIKDLNGRFCELVGRTASELVERSFVDLVKPESAPRLVAVLASVARDGEVRGAELELRAGDGRDRVVQFDATRISDGAAVPIGAQATLRDVTDERRLMRELDAERRLLQTIYECVPAACILFDRDGTILAANPLVDQVCNTSAPEMVGRNAIEIFGNPGPAGCPVTRAFMTGKIEQQVSWVKNRAGETVYVHRTAGPIVRDGQVEKVIEMMVDVTSQLRKGDLRVLSLWQGQPNDNNNGHARVERRASPRATTSFAARYALHDVRAIGTVTSLGHDGLFLEVSHAAPVGSEIQIEWSLPNDDVPVRASGVVVWTRPPSDDRPAGLGCRFVTVTPEFAPISKVS